MGGQGRTLTLSKTDPIDRIKVWTTRTKGTEVTLPVDYDPASDLPKELWVEGCLTSGDVRDVELKVRMSDGAGAAEDTVKVTVVEARWDDAIPDYSGDDNQDSDNFFLRQGDDAELDLYWYIKPDDLELDSVAIKIYEEDGGSPAATLGSADGVPQTAGFDRHVVWDARDGGEYRNCGYYRIELEVDAGPITIKTPVYDADTGYPGWQCPQQGLGIHDLIWKHRPVVHVHADENGAPTSTTEFQNESTLRTVSGGQRDGQTYYDLLSDNECSWGDLQQDFTEEERETFYTDAGSEALHFSSNSDDSEDFVFLQYWMFEHFSTLPDGILLFPGTESVWHEGDLEYVQIAVRRAGEPASAKAEWLRPFGATAAQHYYGQTLGWNDQAGAAAGQAHEQEYVEHDGDRLVIYVAFGAHATYFVADPAVEVPDAARFGFGNNDLYVYDPTPNGGYDQTGSVEITYALLGLWTGALVDPSVDYWGCVAPDPGNHDAPPRAQFRYAIDDANGGQHVELMSNPVRFHNGCICPYTPHGNELTIE